MRPMITQSRNITRSEIWPSYCQTWCRARGHRRNKYWEFYSRLTSQSTCIVQNVFGRKCQSDLKWWQILFWKLVPWDNPVFARIKTSTHTTMMPGDHRWALLWPMRRQEWPIRGWAETSLSVLSHDRWSLSLSYIPQVGDYDEDYHLTSKHTQIIIHDCKNHFFRHWRFSI